MRVLIDVGHPADVHLFKNLCKQLHAGGHVYRITARDKEVTYKLLKSIPLDFIPYGKHHKSLLGKIWGIFSIDRELFKIARAFKPDIFLSLGSFYAAHVAFLLRKPFISFEDTGNMEQILLYKYMASAILTPDTFTKNLGRKQIKFNGTKELAYLHPKWYQPNPEVLSLLGLQAGEEYALVRFVGWNATHDIGHQGISTQNKIKIVSSLAQHLKVFISSETELPAELQAYRLKTSPDKILDIMYYAKIFYGESATMASECAMIGTPAIFVNDARISYTLEQEHRYDLVYNFTESEEDQTRSIEKALELVSRPDLKKDWKEKCEAMMKEKINLTDFLLWFIENWPQSFREMKENPQYQNNFK